MSHIIWVSHSGNLHLSPAELKSEIVLILIAFSEKMKIYRKIFYRQFLWFFSGTIFLWLQSIHVINWDESSITNFSIINDPNEWFPRKREVTENQSPKIIRRLFFWNSKVFEEKKLFFGKKNRKWKKKFHRRYHFTDLSLLQR